MNKKLEARVKRLERLLKNESKAEESMLRVSQLGGTLLSYMLDLNTYVDGVLADKLTVAYDAVNDLINMIDNEL